tara:strand:- start:28 stop:276 length:249 start_codon:yes stop_codon:yes gene_type:complete
MRKYQAIWEAIKQEGSVSIAAPTGSHTRIIKAVRKEKVKDLAWKLVALEDGKRYKLKDDIDGKVITFRLEVDTSSYISDMRL